MKSFCLYATILLIAITVPAAAQSNHSARVDSLKKLAAELRENSKADKKAADLVADDKKFPKKQVLDHKQFELIRVEQDRLIYYVTANLNAAQTVQTTALWPGGSLGLGLSGSGMTLGIWDGGAVRATHQEVSGRVTQIDGATSISNHASHVAGTLIASGINLNARGMAYAAQLHACDWINDHAEMADAAAEGLLVSNHSYTHGLGWIYNLRGDGLWVWMGDPSVSTYEDYYFGLYSISALQMDQIARFAPCYLMVRPAGNDRSEVGPPAGTSYWLYNNGNFILSSEPRDSDGPYDCIGDDGMAKNILTVGGIEDITDNNYSAANIAAKMTVFSSWGPADDGRIKPDLVACGANTYSIFGSADTDYFTLNGTSSAAPNVAGSVALLQQYYQQTHPGALMTSALVKALLINTARESGAAEGPDYSAGWGLVNIAAAAQMISEDLTIPERLQEATLLQGALQSSPLYCSGSEPLKITIAWNDPPGSPIYALNPPTAMLVNDLDLRLTRAADGEIIYPWRLDRAHPSLPATRGDNSVDNVEQICLSTPTPGYYLLTVTHKGTLESGAQDYGLVLSGATAVQTWPLVLSVAGQGQINKSPDLMTYWPGSTVQLSAVPASGWDFTQWSGDLNSTANPATVIMDGPKAITAEFAASPLAVVNTGLEFVSNEAGVPLPGEGTLTFYVGGVARDGLTHAIRDFQGSFLLDERLRGLVIGVSFSGHHFSAAEYAVRTETYDDNPLSPHYGRIFYAYHLTGSNPAVFDEDPVRVSTVEIRYYLAEQHGGIRWNDGVSDFQVTGIDGITLTGQEETPLPGELMDVPLPVELSHFSARAGLRGVELAWSTHSESENAGFHLYRSSDSEEAFMRITHTMIPGAGNSASLQHYAFLDEAVTAGKTYTYRLEDIDYRGRSTRHAPVTIAVAVPLDFSLGQNYPNPFNPVTRFTYSLPKSGWTTLTIYNIQGQVVRTLVQGDLQAGHYVQAWDGRDAQGLPVPSGTYLYRLLQGAQQQTRKMQLLK